MSQQTVNNQLRHLGLIAQGDRDAAWKHGVSRRWHRVDHQFGEAWLATVGGRLPGPLTGSGVIDADEGHRREATIAVSTGRTRGAILVRVDKSWRR